MAADGPGLDVPSAARGSRAPYAASRRRGIPGVLTIALGAGLLLALGSVGVADVVFSYRAADQVGAAASPFRFVPGGNYASASAEGFVTETFSTLQQVGVTVAEHGADGAFATYALDVLEVEARTNTSGGWHAALAVTVAMTGSGINAAYVFYCSAAPTGVPQSGVPVASGTDPSGGPWAVFAPTCPGASASVSLLTRGPGSALAVPPLAFGTTELYLSFALDVSGSGPGPATPATLVLGVTSP